MSETTEDAPKREETAVYDRQIRLWGADAQAKMSKARVLYIHVTGVSSEVLKNCVLAGIRATLCDPRPYPESVQTTPSFFLSYQTDLGEDETTKKDDTESSVPDPKRHKSTPQTVADAVVAEVENLNPLLGPCPILPQSVADLDEATLSQFGVVVASHLSPSECARISKAVVKSGGKFFAVDAFGLDAACMLDLGADHRYRPELGKKLLDAKKLDAHIPLDEMLKVPLHQAVNRFFKKAPPSPWISYRCILEYVQQTQSWPTADKAEDFSKLIGEWLQAQDKAAGKTFLKDNAAALAPEKLQALARVATCELAPSCSVLGGLVGNEVIKAISLKGAPANNTLLFDGLTCKAWTFLVKPKA